MLQDIRKNTQGTVAKIIIGLIVISFSIFGIESLLFSGGTNAVAEVNGEEISAFALQQELSVQQRQLLSMLGENADPALLDEALLNEQALQALIQRRLVRQAALEEGLVVSDALLGEIIGGMSQFQIDGQFSVDLFQGTLASAGFTPAMFRQRLSDDLLQSQLFAGFAGSEVVTDVELAAAARVEAEGRDLRYITLPLDRYREEVEVTEAQIREYYEANSDRFMSEEAVLLDYLELTIEDYREPVPEDRVREEFDIVRDQYQQSTESRVSHILFEEDGESRLQSVREALDGGMAFADAAQEFSDDIGSAADGGDLGYTAGETFPEEMEAAIAALEVGEQGSVETAAGTHLLLVTDRRAGSEVAFEDVRAELEQQLQDAEASAALLQDVERLRDIAFNAADLEAPAEELGLKVARSAPVTRDDGEGPFTDPRLRRAAFSDDVLEAGHNSEVVELTADRFLVLRVAERIPVQVQPLESVRSEIAVTLRDQQALERAQGAARSLFERLEAGEAVDAVANESGLEWQVELGARRDSARLVQPLLEETFALAAPAAGESVLSVVEGSDTLYLLELNRVTPGSLASLSLSERRQLRERLFGEFASVAQEQFMTALQRGAEITVY
jgi:peptidyl-prolyl cis-trans isomerase D